MDLMPELPNPVHCRTQHVINEFWECLVDHSNHINCCRYALGFGFSHFCKHPDNEAFENNRVSVTPVGGVI